MLKYYSNLILNRIKLLEETDKRDYGSIIWRCRCFCGKEFFAVPSKIKQKKIKSCGCLNAQHWSKNIQEALKNYKDRNLVDGTSLLLISKNLISSNGSRYKGIVWDKKRQKWRVRISFQKREIYLGRFDDIEDAIKARKEAEEKYFKPILEKYKKEAE